LALDAKTRVITQQILSSSEARPTNITSSSEWSVRFPIQTVIFDNEGIDVRKLDDFLAVRLLRLLYSIPSIFDERNNKRQPENNDFRATGKSRARAGYLTRRELSKNLL
jgi:hypothetical protein